MKHRIFSICLVLGLLLLAASLLVTRKASALTPTVTSTPIAKPDLIILSVVGHQNGLAGSGCVLNAVNNDLQVTIQNIGNATSGVFEVSATGRNNKYQAVPSLAAGATIILTFTELPSDSMNVVTVDSTGLVAESQEGNNSTNYTSPTLAAPCTSTPTPPGFKTPTKTPTGTQACLTSGQVAYDHTGGAGLVNVPIFAAHNTGTPNPGIIATTGPYGAYKAGCMAGMAVYGQLSGFKFNPTVVNVSGAQSNLGFVAMANGIPTYTATPSTPTATPTRILQYTFSGIVSNAVTFAPVGGAIVHVYQCNSSQSVQATTAADGTYSMNVPASILCAGSNLQVVASGYVTQTAWSWSSSDPANIVVNVALQPSGVITPTPTNGALPDLTVSSVTYLGSSPACANSPKVQVVVANIGAFPATGSFSVSLTGSAPQTVSSLGAGQSVTLIFSASGTTATADSTNVIAETNESNNSLTGSFGLPTQAHTCTPTSGTPLTPTRTPTITLTPTRTSTPGGTCSPVTSTITIPFIFDGAGVFCWQASSLGGFINSWNTTSVSVNGMNVTNVWVGSGSYPAKIGGFYYVSYNSAGAFGHFEAKP